MNCSPARILSMNRPILHVCDSFFLVPGSLDNYTLQTGISDHVWSIGEIVGLIK
jgi:hypothetical protein